MLKEISLDYANALKWIGRPASVHLIRLKKLCGTNQLNELLLAEELVAVNHYGLCKLRKIKSAAGIRNELSWHSFKVVALRQYREVQDEEVRLNFYFLPIWRVKSGLMQKPRYPDTTPSGFFRGRVSGAKILPSDYEKQKVYLPAHPRP